MPEFEVFRKRMVPLVKQPYVTIQRRGVLSFNHAAHEALGKPAAIELLYDAAAQVMGVRGVDPTTEHAYAFRQTAGRSNGSFMVSGIAFAKYYGIPTEVSRRYPAYMDGDVLCVDLSAEGTEVTSNRRGKGASPAAESWSEN